MLKITKRDLEQSGISVHDAKRAEMYSVKDASKVHPDFQPWPALVIPYIDPWTDDFVEYEISGKALPFCRVRYYTPEPKTQGFGKSKRLRYSQPRNSGVHPYFPIAEDTDWVEIAANSNTPIMITEGEKKSLAACLQGIPTIGLGGVYNFMQQGELLGLLDRIEWQGRPVYICYDSDAVTNNAIQAAEARLATELSQKRGAHVFLVRLPEDPNKGKVGVDDFIVEHGGDALFDLLDTAPDMLPMDKEILKLNSDVAWVEAEGMVYDFEKTLWIRKPDFVSGSVYSTRKILVPAKKGAGFVTHKVAPAWLESPLARRYNEVKFSPWTTEREVRAENGGVNLNLFQGLESEEGDVAPFFELHDWLLSRTDEFDRDLVWKIICYKIQNLAARIDLGIMMIGDEGSGKSMFAKTVSEMVAPYDKVMRSKELGSDYNGWIEKTLIVSMSESTSHHLKENISTLKTLITDKRQSMNDKYRRNRDVDNYAFFLFDSNERSAAAFSDDDRRMIIVGCPGPHPEGAAFYERVGDWRDNGGPKKLLHYFQNYDLKGWEPPNTAPQTREKRMAYLASLTPIQQLAHTIKQGEDNIILTWIAASLDWAFNAADDSALAATIASTLTKIQIRPFYTPEELTLLFPQIISTLRHARVSGRSASNTLAREFLQVGIDYLRCSDNMDGFMHKGVIRQYFIVSDHEHFRKPISQETFNDLMQRFPTYEERLEIIKKKTRKKRRKS